jgi:hypothetical protein
MHHLFLVFLTITAITALQIATGIIFLIRPISVIGIDERSRGFAIAGRYMVGFGGILLIALIGGAWWIIGGAL